MGFQDGLADFGSFYERTYEFAYRVAYGIVGERGMAEDVTQDAHVNAFRERRRFRADGPPEAWLYRIVVNGAVSALRRRRVRFVQPLDPAGAGVPGARRAPCRGGSSGPAREGVVPDGTWHRDTMCGG